MKPLLESIMQSRFQTHKIEESIMQSRFPAHKIEESIMQSREPRFKIGESILSKSGVGKIHLIQKWLDEHGIKNYTINSKEEIDVDGRVVLTNNHFREFPKYIQFNIVKGSFYCNFNELISLKGAPREVGGEFYCNNNSLKSLEGAPKKIDGSFFCNNNNLESLEGAPREVGGDFVCNNNNLESLEDAPEKIGGIFDCGSNNLTTLKGAPKEAKYFNCEQNTIKFTEDDVKKVCKVKYKIHV